MTDFKRQLQKVREDEWTCGKWMFIDLAPAGRGTEVYYDSDFLVALSSLEDCIDWAKSHWRKVEKERT